MQYIVISMPSLEKLTSSIFFKFQVCFVHFSMHVTPSWPNKQKIMIYETLKLQI